MQLENEIQQAERGKSTLPIYIALLGAFSILVFQPWQKALYMSLGTWIIVFSAALCFMFSFKRNINSNKLFLLLLLVGCSVISFFVGSAVNYQSLVSLLCFFEFPIFLIYLDNGGLQEKPNKVIYWLFYVLSWYYIFLFFTNKAYLFRGEYGEEILDELTLGYPNPNQTGVFLMISFFILVCAFSYFKSNARILFLLNAAFVFYMILETQSRICAILSILFMISALFQRTLKIKKWLYVVAFSFPIAFLLFSLMFSSVYENLNVWGDSFDTGRALLYEQVLGGINIENVWFGRFQQYAFENMHNMYLTVLGTVGLFGLVAFIAFIYTSSKKLANKTSFSYQKLALFGFLLTVIHSSVEASVFVSGSAYAVLAMSLICLASPISGQEAS